MQRVRAKQRFGCFIVCVQIQLIKFQQSLLLLMIQCLYLIVGIGQIVIMKESRPQRYSYNYANPRTTSTTKSIPPSSNTKQDPLPFHIQHLNKMKDQLIKGHQTIQNLKAEVELEKQAKQLMEEQGKYLSKKVQTLHETIDKLEAEVDKYKEKYRKMKHKKESAANPEPFEDSNYRSKEAELFLKEQETLKVKIRALQSKVHTPSKPLIDSVPKANYQRLLNDNNRLNQRNIELEKMLKFIQSKLKQKQIQLLQLNKQIDIYHASNFKAEQGFDILERQMQVIMIQNQDLKQIIIEKEEKHQRELIRIKEQRQPAKISGSLSSIPRNKNKLHYHDTSLITGQLVHSRYRQSIDGCERDSHFLSTNKIKR